VVQAPLGSVYGDAAGCRSQKDKTKELGMATDYDAPRGNPDEAPEDASLQALRTQQANARSATAAQLLEDVPDDAEAHDLPGSEVDAELTAVIIPQQSDELVCSSCFLVRHRDALNAKGVCTDCS
jgi:hypothetical protein